jgi:hypothetical protein
MPICNLSFLNLTWKRLFYLKNTCCILRNKNKRACSETLLTGDPSSRSVGAPLGRELLPPRCKQTVDPLDQ